VHTTTLDFYQAYIRYTRERSLAIESLEVYITTSLPDLSNSSYSDGRDTPMFYASRGLPDPRPAPPSRAPLPRPLPLIGFPSASKQTISHILENMLIRHVRPYLYGRNIGTILKTYCKTMHVGTAVKGTSRPEIGPQVRRCEKLKTIHVNVCFMIDTLVDQPSNAP
jgi:hypothetical protein